MTTPAPGSPGETPMRDDDDRAEIISVIEEETAAWLRRDLPGWEACWVHGDHVQHLSARPGNNSVRVYGFDDIRDRTAAGMTSHPVSGLDPTRVRRENWRIRIGRDMAWVTFDQIVPLSAPEFSAPGIHNQMRIMERLDGRWKIACVSQVHNRLGFYECPWLRVEADGRVVEMSGTAVSLLRTHRALALVGRRLCGRTRPDNELLRQELRLAAERLRQGIRASPAPLVFTHTQDGICSLCWVSISDQMLVVLFDDERLTEHTIRQAGAIYHLTAGQICVALEIAKGLDLPRTAEALGVRVNTVRTHVRRMFDRVGVTSQPALMRALLSVEARVP